MNEVVRQEKKYHLTLDEYKRASCLLDRILTGDSHNGRNGYRVRSLYFDTPQDRDYYDKVDGLELRRKIRLRVYDPGGGAAFLEMKQKQGEYQKKRSLRITREEAARMTKGDYSFLTGYREPFAAEIYALMQTQCYRPRVIVEYLRKAYIAKENRIRITFDHELRSTISSFDLLSDKLCLHNVSDPFGVILEVKYNGFLLSYIKEMLGDFDRDTLSVSKYCLGREDKRFES